MIDLRDIRKSFDIGWEILDVLKGVSLTIQDGEFVALMWPSWSGKSTLMNIVGLLDTPTSGSYLLDSLEVANLSEYDQAVIRWQKIGFIFQWYNLIPRMPVIEQVMLPLLYQNIDQKSARSIALSVLEEVWLWDKYLNKPTELSGWQQQRVCIARSIVANPTFILADEPTWALDSQTGREIMELLAKLHSQGKTIFLITHDPKIAQYADRIIHISDGLIV
jgi:putative ABC transport system ATP-binding protein